MNYWFLYNMADGSIYGQPYLGNADEWTNIPTGCAVLGPFDEAKAGTTVKDAFAHPNYYIAQNDNLVAVANIATLQLADAKQAKISEITNAYQTELNGTFTSSATGATLVYDYIPTSQNLWKELKDTIGTSVDGGTLPDSVLFPNGTMNITLANNTSVPHTRAQLQKVIQDATARKLQLYQKLQGMVTANGTVMSATTVDTVNMIVW